MNRLDAQADESAVVLSLHPTSGVDTLPPAEAAERTRIVCLGGGTGLPVVLRGLARKVAPRPGRPGLDITALVAMSDDGGSSGRLRRTHGLLPPGDVRNCLVALASPDAPLAEVFQYRFGGSKNGLGGHALGNLLIAALAELKGDFLSAVEASAQILNAQGTVLPSTLESVQLVAEMEDGTLVVGERNICSVRGRIGRVSLQPRRPAPCRGAVEAIERAELIVIGPGSLYSSILPNLLVDGVAAALREAKAPRVLVANLMTQPGETDGMSGRDHVRAVLEHAGPILDAVLLNRTPPALERVEHYARSGSHPVIATGRELRKLGLKAIKADLLHQGLRIRHDSRKLARCLLKVARQGV